MQRDGEVGDRRSLLLMDGAPDGSRLGGRTRDVEQQQNRQVTPPAQAVEVDSLVRHRPGPHLDARLDCRVDVDVVALGLTMTTMQAHAEPGERTPHSDGAVDGLRAPTP